MVSVVVHWNITEPTSPGWLRGEHLERREDGWVWGDSVRCAQNCSALLVTNLFWRCRMSRLQSNGFVRIRFIFRLIVILWACALPLQSVEFGVVFCDIVRVDILLYHFKTTTIVRTRNTFICFHNIHVHDWGTETKDRDCLCVNLRCKGKVVNTNPYLSSGTLY